MAAKKLSSAEKAATVLITLGEELASEIMAKMNPQEVRRVATAIAGLGRIPDEQAAAVAAEFCATLSDDRRSLVGNAALVGRLFAKLGRDGDESLGQAVDLATPLLTEALADFSVGDLLTFLRLEHPQTAALVLAHCSAQTGGAVLKGLSAPQRSEVMQRLATLGPVAPSVIEDLVDALREAAERLRPTSGQALGGAAKLAAMMGRLGTSEQNRLLTELSARDPALAEAVRRGMFTFGDLRQLEAASVQTLMAAVPAATLRLALKGATPELAAFFYANMSPRAGQMLREDIDAMPKARASEVAAAQQELASLAQRLAAEGKLRILSKDEVYV